MDDADQLEQCLREVAQSVSFVVGELFRPERVKIEQDNWTRVLRGEFARISPVREQASRLIERHRHALRSKRTEYVSCGRGLVAASYSELIALASETLSKWLDKFLTNNEQKNRSFSEWERIWGELGFDAMTNRFLKWVDLGIESNMLIEVACIRGMEELQVKPSQTASDTRTFDRNMSRNERELLIKGWQGIQARFQRLISVGAEIDATFVHVNETLSDQLQRELSDIGKKIRTGLRHPGWHLMGGYGQHGMDGEVPWIRSCWLDPTAVPSELHSFEQTANDAARLLNQLPEFTARQLWSGHPKLPDYGCDGYAFWSGAVLHLAMRELPGSPLSDSAECHSFPEESVPGWPAGTFSLGWQNWMLLETDPAEKYHRISEFSPSYWNTPRWWYVQLPAFIAKSCQAIEWILVEISAEVLEMPSEQKTPTEAPAGADGDESVPNGPFLPNEFRFQGKTVELPPGPYAVLTLLWGKPQVSIDAAYTAAKGDDNAEWTEGAIKGLLQRLNESLLTVGYPRSVGKSGSNLVWK